MTSDRDLLPHDIEQLKQLVLRQRAQLAANSLEIEHLKILIAKLRRAQFGRSSEKLGFEIEQLELRLEELQSGQAQAASVVAPAAPPLPPPVRRPLPEHLPREAVVHRPSGSCPDCGSAMRQIGEDVAEVLDYVPACFKVIRHVRPKLACVCCERIVQESAPSRPIDRGLAGAGLLAHIVVAKYCDHLPLYRQAQILAPAKGWSWSARRWPNGLAESSRWSTRSPQHLPAMCSGCVSSMPTTRRCRCSIRVAAGPRPGGYGPMFGTIDPPVAPSRLRCCFAIRPTGALEATAPTSADLLRCSAS